METDPFTEALSQGPLYAAGAAVLGGLLVSLTPCVYPMVAVTVSAFGARETKSRWEGASLSAMFVAGIVAMFTPLGVVAGLTGEVFGSLLQNQWVVFGVAGIFVAMAASMFGAFNMALPAGLMNRLTGIGGLGYRGAFGLGFVCGIIAAPCTGPVLTGILAFIAKTQSAGLGAAAMAAFALGLGFPFFLVGTFAVQLPKSGPWMVHVKSVLGIVLLVVALYFISLHVEGLTNWVTPSPLLYGLTIGASLVGVLLGAIHRDFAEPGVANRVSKGLGTALVTAALFATVLGFTKPARSLSWEPLEITAARSQAQAEGRPLLVDFTASWCLSCRELDKHTFSDPKVEKEAGRFLAVKVDATDDEDPKVVRALAEFKVRGLPTVILYDSQGREAKRFNDFVEAGPFYEALQRVD